MTEIKTDLYLGDCLEVLANFDIDSFDLIMTSPPYADRRPKRMVESIPMNMSIGLCLVLKNF